MEEEMNLLLAKMASDADIYGRAELTKAGVAEITDYIEYLRDTANKRLLRIYALEDSRKH